MRNYTKFRTDKFAYRPKGTLLFWGRTNSSESAHRLVHVLPLDTVYIIVPIRTIVYHMVTNTQRSRPNDLHMLWRQDYLTECMSFVVWPYASFEVHSPTREAVRRTTAAYDQLRRYHHVSFCPNTPRAALHTSHLHPRCQLSDFSSTLSASCRFCRLSESTPHCTLMNLVPTPIGVLCIYFFLRDQSTRAVILHSIAGCDSRSPYHTRGRIRT